MQCFKKKFLRLEPTVTFCYFLLIASDNHDIVPRWIECFHQCEMKYDVVFVLDDQEKRGSQRLNNYRI